VGNKSKKIEPHDLLKVGLAEHFQDTGSKRYLREFVELQNFVIPA
jgi:hypothetical protein